jgi:hypothetical protein
MGVMTRWLSNSPGPRYQSPGDRGGANQATRNRWAYFRPGGSTSPSAPSAAGSVVAPPIEGADRRRRSRAGHRHRAGTTMKKTSLTHPLQIATISAGSDFGRVGITFCPGKYDRHARSGEWNRDLALDLNTIRNWGAAAVVTLLEPKELALLRVESLGEEVLRRNMSWFHLPFVDVSIPDDGSRWRGVALDFA